MKVLRIIISGLVVGLLWYQPFVLAKEDTSDNSRSVNIQLAQANESEPQAVQPPSPAPTNLPPPPPAEVSVPPSDETGASEQQVAPTGQWVYTNQYGWVWMPYGDAYTYVPPSGAEPNMYVYYPTVGWSWVVAPWLWGFGPIPFFGMYGPWHFGWYGHGYGHWYGFAGHYGNAGWGGHGYWHGGQWHGYSSFSPGHSVSPHQGGYGISPRSGYRAPAIHSFVMPQRGFAGRNNFSSHSGHSYGISRGGFSGGGGSFSGHGGHSFTASRGGSAGGGSHGGHSGGGHGGHGR